MDNVKRCAVRLSHRGRVDFCRGWDDDGGDGSQSGFRHRRPPDRPDLADERMQSNGFEHPRFGILAAGKQLQSLGKADDLMPSFDPSATLDDQHLMLWPWDEIPPDRVRDSDPSRRLPKDQL